MKLPIPIQQEWYLSQIFTVIPMLFHINTILAEFYWCFHARDVQIVLLKHITLILALHCDTISSQLNCDYNFFTGTSKIQD